MKRKNAVGLLFILFGIVIFMVRLNDYSFSSILRQYWPVLIIIAGVLTLFSGEGRGIVLGDRREETEDYVDYMNVFSGLENVNTSKDFRGGAITTIFGGAEIDLRDAVISSRECKLSITTIFGGVEVKLPENSKLVVSGAPIFGGLENTKRPVEGDDIPTVYIRYFVMFGGIEIS